MPGYHTETGIITNTRDPIDKPTLDLTDLVMRNLPSLQVKKNASNVYYAQISHRCLKASGLSKHTESQHWPKYACCPHDSVYMIAEASKIKWNISWYCLVDNFEVDLENFVYR